MKKIPLIVVIFGVILLIIGLGSAVNHYAEFPAKNETGVIQYYQVTCSIELYNQQYPGWLVDDVEIEAHECTKKPVDRGFLSMELLVNEGEVCIDAGKAKQCSSYKLWEGFRDTKTLTIERVADPSVVNIRLYDADGNEYLKQKKVVPI